MSRTSSEGHRPQVRSPERNLLRGRDAGLGVDAALHPWRHVRRGQWVDAEVSGRADRRHSGHGGRKCATGLRTAQASLAVLVGAYDGGDRGARIWHLDGREIL